ncbi:MAG: rRNA maturation RNase YbeY [Patescibacteria group bacterium]
MKGEDFCTITILTKGTLPRVPFVSIKNVVLGQGYELGISFVSPATQRAFNRRYRGKDTTTNILSFPLSETSGDITFDLGRVRKDAPLHDMTYRKFLTYLLIHGLLHLKGFEHSSTMEKEERKFLKMFS